MNPRTSGRTYYNRIYLKLASVKLVVLSYQLMTKALAKPLFDSLDEVKELFKASQHKPSVISEWLTHCLGKQSPQYAEHDFRWVLSFLYSYRGSPDTFNGYRRELERLLQWSWFIKKSSILEHKRDDIEAYLEFCRKPPKTWIGTKTVARFTTQQGQRAPNPAWRPFIVKVSKKAHQDGATPNINDFELSQQAIKAIFAILSSFYNFLIQEDITEVNPLLQIRQKSQFIRKQQGQRVIRRLSDMQWQTVIHVAQDLAAQDPEKHERTLFIMNALYGMYLRISELASSDRWTPEMSDFARDINGNWWFQTVGKGNKSRQIAVSDAMLAALKRWRQFLGLTALPTPDDKTSLLPKQRGPGPMTSTRAIRNIVQQCFDIAVERLRQSDRDEAEMLRSATVHWLRHTGISDDVKHRPREHVRDDAGHSSSAITDRYIDIELQERAKSAKKKTIS